MSYSSNRQVKNAAAASRAAATRFMVAKYAGVCAETGEHFAAFATVLHKDGRYYCDKSQAYQTEAAKPEYHQSFGASY